jgi:hypothetical protein
MQWESEVEKDLWLKLERWNVYVLKREPILARSDSAILRRVR